MTELLSGKTRILNHLLIILIFITSLFFIRNIINLISVKGNANIVNKENISTSRKDYEKKDIMSYSVILKKNPFGKSMELHPLIATQSKESNDIRTLSDIILVGTAVGPKEMSYAIFASKGSKEQMIFTYGEDVFNYGRLIAIEPEYVKIEHDSNIITIDIIDISSLKSTAKPVNIHSQNSSFVKKIGERDYLINRDKVQDALENPEQILIDARLLPHFKSGKQQGFKVYEVRQGGLYESLGLRNGDILLKINGLDISSPEVAIQAMSALRGMDRINLDIMRGGAKLSLNYQIR